MHIRQLLFKWILTESRRTMKIISKKHGMRVARDVPTVPLPKTSQVENRYDKEKMRNKNTTNHYLCWDAFSLR